MSQPFRLVAFACLVTVATALAACAKADRVRPVKMGEVDTGAGSLESVRRQLEGTWTLSTLEVTDAAGKTTAVPAGGRMTYDAYGNFDLAIQIDPAAAQQLGTNAAALDLRGRAVIDVAGQSLRVQGVEAAAESPGRENVDRVRHYAFEGDTLRLTVKDAAGRVRSSSTWKRQP